MKKRNVQTIKHVIGVLTAEGSGNDGNMSAFWPGKRPGNCVRNSRR